MHAIRRADEQRAEAIARLLRSVRRAGLPFLPQPHTPDEDLWFVRNVISTQCEVWAAGSGDIDGFIAFHEIERTDGSRNEEREPDILFAWARG